MPHSKGKVTLYEGVSKKNKKPFKALLLEVGDWSALHFVDSRFELDYLVSQLKDEKSSDDLAADAFFKENSGSNSSDGKINLEEE